MKRNDMEENEIQVRLQKLRAAMADEGLDAALLTSGVSIRYYTGFTSDECFVLVGKERCGLITDFRYTIQAKEQVKGLAEVMEVNQTGPQLVALEELLKAVGAKSCGYEEQALNVGAFNRLQAFGVAWRPFGDRIAAPRLVKSKREAESLQKAQTLADRAYEKLLEEIAPGMTEREVAARLNYICALLGSEGPSFDPIVGSGPNGAMCHAIPGDRRLRNGDLVVVDFGCVVDGYHSDMTRTFGVGRVDDELVKIYDITREAQRRALEGLRPGITGAELDGIAREYIEKQGYGPCFGHGLGHGFGLEIHEAPRAGQSSSDVLQAGMTVTIEPGVYLEGKGGVRIEDCVILTDAGYINLVSSAKELLFI